MKLSTRSRYGVRLMFEIALQHGKRPVILREVAQNQEISEKYLSLIIIPLRNNGLVRSSRSVPKGYSLTRDPKQITIKEIVGILEGGLEVTATGKRTEYDRASDMIAQRAWKSLNESIANALSAITLSDLVHDWESGQGRTAVYQI